MTSVSEQFLAGYTPPTPQDDLLDALKNIVRQSSANHPRSLQTALGPSEIGHPCARALAAKMLDLPRINPEYDCLPSWLGVAGHSKFEEAAAQDNQRIISARAADEADNGLHAVEPCTFVDDQTAVGRWLTERRVQIRTGLSGTCDLFDTWTNTVVDLKFPGSTRFDHYRIHGPSPEYRTQVHCYGRGYRNAGYDVQTVGIWFLPRGGQLASSFLWTEPYDDTIVEQALTRIDNVVVALDTLEVEQNPQRIALIPTTAGDHCTYCPLWAPYPRPEAHACRGSA
jgi:hypothetical protein